MKYIALYRTPVAVLEAWMQKPEEERKDAETKMMAEWDAWLKANAAHLVETDSAGKNQRVSPSGIEQVKNDIMMFSIVEAESDEAVAQMFVNHPHFGIPEATIDIMPMKSMSGM